MSAEETWNYSFTELVQFLWNLPRVIYSYLATLNVSKLVYNDLLVLFLNSASISSFQFAPIWGEI